MDRTERFYRIEMLIRHRGCASFEALRQDLEVSPATLKRDLQYLRDRMGAPIVYDRQDNGYRFGRSGTGDSHELPGVWFSEQEIHALLTMHQLIGALDEGGVLSRHLQPLRDRLHSMLGSAGVEATELTRRIRLIGTARRKVPSKYFELTSSALIKRRRIEMQYFTRGRRASSVRVVSPQRLVSYRNTWYLDAWCHKTESLKRFALDAIESAEPLEIRAKEVPMKTIEAELDGSYGIFGGSRIRWATLVFSEQAALWVSREEWHPDQIGRWLDDGRYELRVPYSDPTEILMDILRHGEQVEVMEDQSLRAEVAQRSEAMSALYANLIQAH